MMNTIAKRLATAGGIVRQDGLFGLWQFMHAKWRFRPLDFDAIADITRDELNRSGEVIRALTNGLAYVYGMAVPGDVAEFGTMTGRTATAIAVGMRHLNSQYVGERRGARRAWFFDSFEGLPESRFEVDRQSPHVAAGIWARGTCRGLNEEQFTALVSRYLPADDFHVLKGWFKDTVPTIPKSQKFAFLHVDGDLYESAIDVLSPLFANAMVSKGAAVYFDDWDCNAADPGLGERRAWREVCERYHIRSSDCGSYGVSGHHFIVHAYAGS